MRKSVNTIKNLKTKEKFSINDARIIAPEEATGKVLKDNFTWAESGDVASTVIAPSYNSSFTYSIGDMIMYNNSLYECVIDISSPEEFTPSHWKQGDVASLIIGLINEEL